MAVPEVNKKLLEELEDMGFPRARATRALHYSGAYFFLWDVCVCVCVWFWWEVSKPCIDVNWEIYGTSPWSINQVIEFLRCCGLRGHDSNSSWGGWNHDKCYNMSFSMHHEGLATINCFLVPIDVCVCVRI